MQNFIENIDVQLGTISNYKIIAYLSELREFSIKVSELKVEKTAFHYMKKMGFFSAFVSPEAKGWQNFNMTERVLIKICEILWRYGYDTSKIKEIVSSLLNDDWINQKINSLLDMGPYNYVGIEQKPDAPSMSFVEYCVLQKSVSNRIRLFTNLDALIILAIELKKPVSIIVDGKGDYIPFVGSELPSKEYSKYLFQIFQSTFLNISILDVFDTFIPEVSTNSPLLNPNLIARKRVDLLLRKGFDAASIRQAQYDNEGLIIEPNELEPNINLNKVKNQYSNQDIVLKVRDSKVKSVNQIIIRKK